MEAKTEISDSDGSQTYDIPKRKSCISRIKDKFFRALKNERFDETDAIIDSVGPEAIKTFCEKEGYYLFNCALIWNTAPKLLAYLIRKVPSKCIYDSLKVNDFHVIKCFIDTRIKNEKDEAELEISLEKLKILKNFKNKTTKKLIKEWLAK